jgi:hypothetical protein
MGAIIGAIAKAAIPAAAEAAEGASQESSTNSNFKVVEVINTPGYVTNLINQDNYKKGIDQLPTKIGLGREI